MGPAKVLEIDETGVTAHFQSQTFKVARFCVRRRVKESEVVDKDGQVPRSTADPWAGNWHAERDGGRASVEEDAPMEPVPVGDGDSIEPVQPQVTQNSMASPRLIPAPESPRNGEDLEPPLPPTNMDDPSASFDNQCAPSQAPIMEGSQYDNLTYDELHYLCKSRGYCKKDAKTAL